MTVPKRLITTPERHASTVAAIAARVAERWPKVEAVAAAMAPPTMRASGGGTGRSAGGHADPVAANVVARIGGVDDEEDPSARDRLSYDDLVEATNAWLEQGKWIERRQVEYLREHPDTAAAKTDALKTLCVYPGCDFDKIAARGLCWHHYRREVNAVDALQDADQGGCFASKRECDTTAIVEQSASRKVEAIRTTWCRICGADVPVPDGVDPAAAVEAHGVEVHP